MTLQTHHHHDQIHQYDVTDPSVWRHRSINITSQIHQYYVPHSSVWRHRAINKTPENQNDITDTLLSPRDKTNMTSKVLRYDVIEPSVRRQGTPQNHHNVSKPLIRCHILRWRQNSYLSPDYNDDTARCSYPSPFLDLRILYNDSTMIPFMSLPGNSNRYLWPLHFDAITPVD